MGKYKQLFMESQLRINGLIDDINNGKFNPEHSVTKSYAEYLNTQDMIAFCSRYIWNFNNIINLTSQQLESFFYQRKDLLIVERDNRLEFTDYAENGKLQLYGRLNKVKPITFSGTSYSDMVSVIKPNGENNSDAKAIIVSDYTSTYAGRGASRLNLNNVLISDEAIVYKQLINNINMSIKKAIASCDNVDQAKQILEQARNIMNVDTPILPIAKGKGKSIVDIPVEMFNFNNTFDTQNYCQQIEFYAKKRRQDMGISTPDTFEKKERKITSESANANIYSDLILYDGYYNRLNALNLAKKYFKIPGIEGVTVEINPVLLHSVGESNGV